MRFITGLKRRGPGEILISAEQDSNCLVLKIIDDGIGIREEDLSCLREELNSLVILNKDKKNK